MVNLAIVGSRKYNNYELVKAKILEWEKENKIHADTIVSGKASGVDSLAMRFAKEEGRNPKEFPPEYDKYVEKYGKKIGTRRALLERNTLIVDYSDYLIAFPDEDSRGTWDSVRKAKIKKIPITIHKV